MTETSNPASYLAKRETYGKWLLAQRDRGDWVNDLANAARADRTFPKEGDPEAVRAHLRKQQADSYVFQAVDDAEADWQSLR
ncbi:YozE family protein [Sphingomonas endolithica]|uniref:YozE family protein n=1 Tax=Sphingomonas endolithica TaxID=2972485 RepID=UPI0021AF4C83|nr:YozE family protein [Sphingomonas sp. ZFBP2030]